MNPQQLRTDLLNGYEFPDVSTEQCVSGPVFYRGSMLNNKLHGKGVIKGRDYIAFGEFFNGSMNEGMIYYGFPEYEKKAYVNDTCIIRFINNGFVIIKRSGGLYQKKYELICKDDKFYIFEISPLCLPKLIHKSDDMDVNTQTPTETQIAFLETHNIPAGKIYSYDFGYIFDFEIPFSTDLSPEAKNTILNDSQDLF